MEGFTFNTTFEGVRETGGSRQARGTVRNPVWLKHEVQGSLGVERPFTLWNPVFLLAWQLLQNKFKVVLQMMPWRLSRSHLNCLFVICKNLPNLQPTVAVWKSLVYGAVIVSWVIIFLERVCVCVCVCVCVFYLPHLENMPRYHVDFSQAPVRFSQPSLSCSDGNAVRVVLTISLLSPGPLP